MMAAVKRRLKITAIAFKITSTRTMPRYYPPPFKIRTTVCQATSSAMKPSRNASWTSSTKFYHLVVSLSFPPFVIYFSVVSRYHPSGSEVLPTASVSTSVAASDNLFSLRHYRRWSGRIWEGPPGQCPSSLCTAHSTSSSVGKNSSIREGGMDLGIISPPGGEYSPVELFALHRDPLECDPSGWRCVVYCLLVPPPIIYIYL